MFRTLQSSAPAVSAAPTRGAVPSGQTGTNPLEEKVESYRAFAMNVAQGHNRDKLRPATLALIDSEGKTIAKAVLDAEEALRLATKAETAFQDRLKKIEDKSNFLEELFQNRLLIGGFIALVLLAIVAYFAISSGALGGIFAGFGSDTPNPTPAAVQQAPAVARPGQLTAVKSTIPGVSDADFNNIRNTANSLCLTTDWRDPAKAAIQATTYAESAIRAKPKGSGFDVNAVMSDLVNVKLNPSKCPTK